MSAIHQYYYQHLVGIHNGLRSELKYCISTLSALVPSTSISPCSSLPASSPPPTKPAFNHLFTSTPLRTALRNTLQFCIHLQRHHDIEEAVIFPEFAKVTNISHWSKSHRELDATLERVRTLARYGLMIDRFKMSHDGGKNFGGHHHHQDCDSNDSDDDDRKDEDKDEDEDEEEKEEDQERHEAKFLKKKVGRLVRELETLAKIVLPHLVDEEVMSTPEKTIELWPTEKAMATAFPWVL
ncbi:hypothetical protein BG004_003818 [Podila humilis]|nr:hypothetical protein BG004_003818 [Podila humilis]